MLEKMFQREVQFKKSSYEELKSQVKDIEQLISQNQLDLKHAQGYWDDKIKETDGRIAIREQELNDRKRQVCTLNEEIGELQVNLDKADKKLEEQEQLKQKILDEIDEMNQKKRDIDRQIQDQKELIKAQNGLLTQEVYGHQLKRS